MLEGPFRGSAALAARQISRAVLHGPRFRRLFPDVYLPADLSPDLSTRSRAAYLWSGGRGVLGGYSAAELYAAGCAPSDAPAEIVLPETHRHPPPGLIVRQDQLAGDERRHYRQTELTSPSARSTTSRDGSTWLRRSSRLTP